MLYSCSKPSCYHEMPLWMIRKIYTCKLLTSIFLKKWTIYFSLQSAALMHCIKHYCNGLKGKKKEWVIYECTSRCWTNALSFATTLFRFQILFHNYSTIPIIAFKIFLVKKAEKKIEKNKTRIRLRVRIFIKGATNQ